MRVIILTVLFAMSVLCTRAEAITFDFVWNEVGGTGQVIGEVSFVGDDFNGGWQRQV